MTQTPPPFKAACVQVNASDDMAANIDVALGLVREAAKAGAQFIALPENVSMMTLGHENILSHAKSETEHPAIPAFRELARELGVWLHGGSLSIKDDEGGERLFNRAYVFSPDGEVAARYDKIHMFDVDLGNGESYRESETFKPGEAAVTAQLPWGKLGMSTCYDVRFPHLYRELAKAGAIFLSVPAAFTRTTGRAHWHLLLRTRAVENGAYVFAPAQTGEHVGGRETYGHSLIVDPWGAVLADGGEDVGFIIADIDPQKVLEARARVPSLLHDRDFGGERV